MNEIIIEQNPDDTRLAFDVNQNAAIDRIRLSRAKVSSQVIDEQTERPVAIVFNLKSKPLPAPSRVLRLEIAFRMAGVEETEAAAHKVSGKDVDEKKPEPVVLVECAYEVDYVVREGFLITPEHVKAFKDGNAIFNTWPFFREYLQNTLQRMGLPPLTAPFLRLQPKPKPRKRDKDASDSGGAPGGGTGHSRKGFKSAESH